MEKGAYTYGVDSNPDWFNRLPQDGSYKGHHRLTDDENAYLLSIHYLFNYDIIVIDGLYRDKCTEQALKRLSPGGYLIIDNFEQPSVEEFWPLTRKLIEGMPLTIYKEPSHVDWQTAVITKP